MRSTTPRWLFFALILFIIQISATSPEYKNVFQDNEFMMESVHQLLATDLDNDGRTEMILTGKNYTTREVFIYWLAINPNLKPVIKWQSENLFEDLSIMWLCNGKFLGDQNQLLAISNSRLLIYQANKDNLSLVKQEVHKFTKILAITSGDLNGDGRDELIIARIGKVTNKFYNGQIEVWQLGGVQPTLLAESDLFGNIRSITAGDIDGDGKSEVIIDEGLRFAPGNIHIVQMKENKLQEISQLKKGVNGAVYSMVVAGFKEGNRLVTASSSGTVNFFGWSNHTLVPLGGELLFDNELVSITALATTNNSKPNLAVIGYPDCLIMLSPNLDIN